MRLFQQRQMSLKSRAGGCARADARRCPQAMRWALVAASVCGLLNCTTDDTGKLCGNPNTVFPTQPIDGENPTVEVIRLDRDSTCDTFDCLTHLGLHAYCTRECKYNPVPSHAHTCSTEEDCRPFAPLHCHNGYCNDDDCPKGFWCETVQEVGPLAGHMYCTRETNCTTHFQCEDIGGMVCEPLACYDQCDLTPNNCPFHQYVCNPDKVPNCGCAGGASTCLAGAPMSCPPNVDTFSATRQYVCMPK